MPYKVKKRSSLCFVVTQTTHIHICLCTCMPHDHIQIRSIQFKPIALTVASLKISVLKWFDTMIIFLVECLFFLVVFTVDFVEIDEFCKKFHDCAWNLMFFFVEIQWFLFLKFYFFAPGFDNFYEKNRFCVEFNRFASKFVNFCIQNSTIFALNRQILYKKKSPKEKSKTLQFH